MQSGIKMAASKQVTKQHVNGVQGLETRPRGHTFTSGHTPNKYNIIEQINNFSLLCYSELLSYWIKLIIA
jgi:hypothetical protein